MTEIWSPSFQLLILTYSQSWKFLSYSSPSCCCRSNVLLPWISTERFSSVFASKFPDEDFRQNFRYFRCRNRKCVRDSAAKDRTPTWPAWELFSFPANDPTFFSADFPFPIFLRWTRRERSTEGRPQTTARRTGCGRNVWPAENRRADFSTWWKICLDN